MGRDKKVYHWNITSQDMFRDFDDDLYDFIDDYEYTINDVIRDPLLLERLIREDTIKSILKRSEKL